MNVANPTTCSLWRAVKWAGIREISLIKSWGQRSFHLPNWGFICAPRGTLCGRSYRWRQNQRELSRPHFVMGGDKNPNFQFLVVGLYLLDDIAILSFWLGYSMSRQKFPCCPWYNHQFPLDSSLSTWLIINDTWCRSMIDKHDGPESGQ